MFLDAMDQVDRARWACDSDRVQRRGRRPDLSIRGTIGDGEPDSVPYRVRVDGHDELQAAAGVVQSTDINAGGSTALTVQRDTGAATGPEHRLGARGSGRTRNRTSDLHRVMVAL